MYYKTQLYFYKKISLKFLLFAAGFFFTIASCKQIDVYEKTFAFTRHTWPSTEKPDFVFTIIDTVARYNIFVVLRHTDAYHYNNLWVNVTFIPPSDTAQTIRANLKLGDNKQWLGNSIDDIVEHRILINPNPLHLKKGNYQFILGQIMREDPLSNILNAGIRVEKAIY